MKKETNSEKAKSMGVSARTLYRWKSDTKHVHGAAESIAGLRMEKLRKEIQLLDARQSWKDWERVEAVFLAGMKCAGEMSSFDADKWDKIRRIIAGAGLADTTTLLEVFARIEQEEEKEQAAEE